MGEKKCLWDSAGNLYGTTFSSQFPGNPGVIFKLDTNGKLTVLYTFTGGADGARSDGLIPDAAGNLYGTTGFLGTGGTLFKLDPSGVKTVLHTFTGGADGAPGLWSKTLQETSMTLQLAVEI